MASSRITRLLARFARLISFRFLARVPSPPKSRGGTTEDGSVP